MDTQTQEKLEKLPIIIIIDGEECKLNAIEVFFINHLVTCWTGHIKLKNYLKRVMDKLLQKVNGVTKT